MPNSKFAITSSILSKFVAKGGDKPKAVISDYQEVAPGLLKVVCTFSHVSAPQDLRYAVAKAFQNRASAVPYSFRELKRNGTQLVTIGYVSANPVVEPYSVERVEKMRVVTANVLMEDDDIWEVKDTEAGKMLVKRPVEDLSALASITKVRHVGTPTLAKLAELSVSASEFITYVDPNTHAVQSGFVLSADDSGVDVLSTTDAEGTFIDSSLIIESRTIEQDAFSEIATPADYNSRAAMIDYYTKIYGQWPEYLSKFVKMIEESGVA